MNETSFPFLRSYDALYIRLIRLTVFLHELMSKSSLFDLLGMVTITLSCNSINYLISFHLSHFLETNVKRKIK